MESYNPLLDNIYLQNKFDDHSSNRLSALRKESDFINNSLTIVSFIVKELSALTHNVYSDDEDIEIDGQLLANIRTFKDELFPKIKEENPTTWNSCSPISSEISDKLFPGDEKDLNSGPRTITKKDAVSLSSSLDLVMSSQNYRLGSITRELKHVVDLSAHCITMTAERAKQNPNRSFIYNQITRR